MKQALKKPLNVLNLMRNDKEKIAKSLIRIRLSQMIVNEEYKAGKIKVPIHLAFGHEAIASAVSAVMTERDKLILSHRNIAYNLARSGSLKAILDEYFLKTSGLAGGKLGSMNLVNPQRGIVYSSSILGNNFAVACGTAMSQKIFNRKGVTVVLGGDGSMEEGSFYESLEMLKSFNLSCLVIIENNQMSLATKIEERRCAIDIAGLVGSLGISYEKLNGNDVYEYIKTLKKWRGYSLQNELPVCIEVDVKTLGDWRMKLPEYPPEGKFIHYHVGLTPSVELKDWPILLRNDKLDPIFALKKYFSEKQLEDMAREIFQELAKELA